MNTPALHIDGIVFRDERNRQVFLRGINFAADAKFPATDSPSYVNSPCTLDEADAHLSRLRQMGFNCLRYVYTWDALEHEGPGKYDEAYIDFTISMLRKIIDYGFYVFLDPHQDAWSRFSGGSGAPLWTLHALGLDPSHFKGTLGAVLYDKDDPKPIKMAWASNYYRLVSQTMFTAFFAGEEYLPGCKINDQNVGAFLRDHYFSAIGYFMRRIKDADLGSSLLGFESVNEPHMGLIGHKDITEFPDSATHVKLGRMPTPFQGMLLGQGNPQTVDAYKFTSLGTKKDSTERVVPTHSIWMDAHDLSTIDKRHGWTRSWSGCPWEHEGVYENKVVKKPKYFAPPPNTSEQAFAEQFFIRHWQRFDKLVASISDRWLVFMQAPVNCPPPDFVGRNIALDHNRVVYTPHFYDGLTLMLKRWAWINVDTVGVCRKLYSNPMFALKLGSRAIRNGFADQFAYLKKEGIEKLGPIPLLMSEIGIPYDMDNKKAYETGFYQGQTQAMDCNHHGLEYSQLNHTLWVYCCSNTHKYGDSWCGEDLSIWSKDDMDTGLDESSYENGVRAAPAVIRPYPICANGHILSFGFDIYDAVFSLEINAANTRGVTEIYLPTYYFGLEPTSVFISSGTYKIDNQVLYWEHSSGRQSLRVKGLQHFSESIITYAEGVSKLISVSKQGFSGLFQQIKSKPSSRRLS